MTLVHPLPPPLVDRIAQRFRVLGEPMRIRLLDHLRDGEASVQELTDALGTTQQNVSNHLGVLHSEGVVSRRRDGARVLYEIADDSVFEICDAARGVAVYVVDAASGRARIVGKGTGVPAPVWLDGARLGFVVGDAVRVVDAASGQELTRLGGGGGVVTVALGESRACAADAAGPFAEPGEVADPAADEPVDDGWDDEPAGAADAGTDTASLPAPPRSTNQ